MKVSNLTNGIIVSDNVKIAKSQKDRIIGLLKEKEARALYLETRWGIHTFGMKFPIDCVILDKDWRVSSIKENVLPWRIFVWNPVFFRVFELPSGTVKKTKIKIGDIISIG